MGGGEDERGEEAGDVEEVARELGEVRPHAAEASSHGSDVEAEKERGLVKLGIEVLAATLQWCA